MRVATQHQALNAVVRFHEEVLGREVEGAEDYLRARRSERVPVVLGRAEVAGLLGQLEGTERLMGELMYGGGLRLMECTAAAGEGCGCGADAGDGARWKGG